MGIGGFLSWDAFTENVNMHAKASDRAAHRQVTHPRAISGWMASQWVAPLLVMAVLLLAPRQATAQFADPVLRKIENAERELFEERFREIAWTGQGLYNSTIIDKIPTMEVRGRLQARFGDPTVKIQDLLGKDFRPGKAIQFEYWFIVDGEMPLMILDLDGPFENGLVYVGASRFIDRMPAVKRALTRALMEETSGPSPYRDYFYSPEREQWYLVRFEQGEFHRDPVDTPSFAPTQRP